MTGTRQLILRSLRVRRGRSLTALLALTVAATIATALFNLRLDLDAKLHTEFRRFGANVAVIARGSEGVPIASVNNLIDAHDLAVPYAYAIAKTDSGQPIVVVGTFIGQARRQNPAWSVTGANDSETILVGKRAAQVLGSEVRLNYSGASVTIKKFAVLSTGGFEDDRIYMPLHPFIAWTGVQPSTVEIAVNGPPAKVEETVIRIAHLFPGLDVRPIRQVVEAEAGVLDKTARAFTWAVLLISFTVGLCVLSTLSAAVLERRKDVAVMKALGSDDGRIRQIFLGEWMLIAAASAVIGFALGCGISMLIGRLSFHAPVTPRWQLFPAILIGSVIIAMISSLVPLARLRKIQPAVMLKGE